MSGTDATDPVKALREWCAINSFLCQHVLDDLRAGKHRGEAGERFLIRDAYAAALRSLEAAPALLARIEAGEGEGVQRAIAAAERTASAVEVDATCRGWTSLENAAATACVPGAFRAAVELRAALAALRASPESVGGAAPSGRAAQAINTAGRIVREAEAERDNAQRTASSLSVELAVAAKERDALKADLAAARGEVERVRADPRLALHFGVSRNGETWRAAFGSLQDAEDDARDWSMKTAKGKYEVVIAKKQSPTTPPPATEAPISERAGAVLVSTVRIYLGEGGEYHADDAGPLKCHPTWDGPGALKVRLAFLAAAERTVKAPQAEG